ncbi:conjugal transfer protein TraG N-terminal domain-containing protein [Vibrio brasiliensis]|uniref:conjugal transfer protein TraG N-terminal domain-containing protein n=1 Tax=Vibrio brasiliensis TaxID=170652 RepID=UPI001EFCEF75|nr:conjugal transfer protein TraG N-terminal domain-containing protein [Vibrio brasiliensis]MCG9727494.1 conjugal transfer protein TraG N-terminal domain-containing protein [Vibrio brasiliensis]
MSLDYYVYTQGATIQRALNAVATYFESSSFASMTSIALMIGAVITMAYFFATRNTRHLYVWAIVFTLVPTFLLNQTTRMQIIDKTEPDSVYSVDNVPYLVALPTWFFSTLMVGVTESVETIFTTTRDQRYGRTGMLFGSEMFQLSRKASLRDIRQRHVWDDFFRNCIVGDIEINKKYSWNQLFNAPDIFDFLSQQSMSPLRGVMLDVVSQDFKTCREIFPDIQRTFGKASAEEMELLGTYLHGSKAALYRPHVKQALENSYLSFVGVSNNAANILRHNMTINAIRSSVRGLAHGGIGGVGINYAYTTNKMQQTSMWATLGLQAREFIPLMHTMMFFLFSCLGIIIGAAALIPALTKMVLTNYIKTFAYLATWPPLFAILNGLMLWGLESTSNATAQPMNGLSLSNSNALEELHLRFGYMAGFLMMAIPVLAGKILQGGVAAVQAMNYQLASMINSSNARAAEASSTGNIDFGNLQMQNHTFNNTSANKLDDNLLVRTGMATVQQSSGASITTLQNDGGRKLYNAQEAVSNPIWQAQATSMVQSSVNDQYSSALTSQKQHMDTFTDSYANSVQQSGRWNDSWSSSYSYGDVHSASTEGQITQSHSKMESAIDSISQTMGWTHDQARAYATSANAGLSIGTPGQTKLGGGFSTAVQWSNEQRDGYRTMGDEQKQALAQAMQQYNEGASSMERAGRTIDAKENRSAVEQYAHDFALNHQRLQSAASSVSASNAEVSTLQSIQSRLESDSLKFGQDLRAPFQEYLENKYPQDSQTVIRVMNATQGNDLKEAYQEFDKYARSDAFHEEFDHYDYGLPSYKPSTRRDLVRLSPEQKSTAQSNASKGKEVIDEITIDMINYRGSDHLFESDAYRNVKGSASVTGGHMQNEAEQPVTPTTNPDSDVVKTVNDHINPPAKDATDRKPHTGYQLHDSKKDN